MNETKKNYSMKRFMQWVMVAALICGTNVFLSSCSKDDDNDPVKKCRLVERKEVYSDTDAYYITRYSYDAQGRLASFVREGYNTDWGNITEANFAYTYGDHFIKEQHGNEGYDLYTLNDDGLIVKHETIRTKDGVEGVTTSFSYQYDNGRISFYKETENTEGYLFQWKDGDLMTYYLDTKRDVEDITEYTRSELMVDHGYIKPPSNMMREPLYMMGYYGKPSKHLESHKTNSAKTGPVSVIYEFDFTYTLDKGHIVELVDNHKVTTDMGVSKTEKIVKQTSTFTYEEY